jgi:hypothetical protein
MHRGDINLPGVAGTGVGVGENCRFWELEMSTVDVVAVVAEESVRSRTAPKYSTQKLTRSMNS